MSTKRCLSIHLLGNGTGKTRWTGGAAPQRAGEGEEVRHVPCVHTWPPLHGIRHPPQLAGSLEVSTHFPKQNICPTGHRRPCAFAANWVMQRNRPIVSPATKARPGALRPLRKALFLIAGQTRVVSVSPSMSLKQTGNLKAMQMPQYLPLGGFWENKVSGKEGDRPGPSLAA